MRGDAQPQVRFSVPIISDSPLKSVLVQAWSHRRAMIPNDTYLQPVIGLTFQRKTLDPRESGGGDGVLLDVWYASYPHRRVPRLATSVIPPLRR